MGNQLTIKVGFPTYAGLLQGVNKTIGQHTNYQWRDCPSYKYLTLLREIPDHATFRGKEHTLGWLDKLGVCLSLALCNLADFDQL